MGRIKPPDEESNEVDIQVLTATFEARVRLAKQSREDAIKFAGEEWDRTQLWLKSESQREGSFLWFCDYFDLEPSAVKRAIREKK